MASGRKAPDEVGALREGMVWQIALATLHVALLTVLWLQGLHRLWMVAAVRGRRDPVAGPIPADPPMVTVQIPLFNERFVAERVIDACAALSYPRHRLELQILDDSTDETSGAVDRAVERARGRGVDAVVLRRPDRVGFKAGALEVGLSRAKGTYVAIFDADFLPAPDFLERTVPLLSEGADLVQARWGHLEPNESWLTRAQATLLDAHFCVEHGARAATGRWFNFNGTAGIWRRSVITRAGGWQHDTLTEDLDLSYRAQLAGARFVYLNDLVVPAELPAHMSAFRTQQRRWARGAVQTCRKLLGRILRSPAPWAVRLEAMAHLTANAGYPLLLAVVLLHPGVVLARALVGTPAAGLDGAWSAAAFVVPFGGYLAAAVRRSGRPSWRRYAEIPLALALGVGLCLSQSQAVWAGLVGDVGAFVRTPKRGAAAVGYASPGDGFLWEALLAAVHAVTVVVAAATGQGSAMPFSLLCVVGCGLVAGAGRSRNRRATATIGSQVDAHSQGVSVQAPLASTVESTR